MGCDIHLYLEKKDNKGNWKLVGPKALNTLFPDRLEDARKYYPDIEPTKAYSAQCPTVDVGRDYEMFALLANVRNYDDIEPLDGIERGIPEDASENLAKEFGGWGSDAHSATHYTLDELVNFEGWQELNNGISSGLVPFDQYKEWIKAGEARKAPVRTCRGVGGIDIEQITMAEANEKILNPELMEAGKEYYVQATWQANNAELAGYLYSKVMPILSANVVNLEDMRLVMWFDN